GEHPVLVTAVAECRAEAFGDRPGGDGAYCRCAADRDHRETVDRGQRPGRRRGADPGLPPSGVQPSGVPCPGQRPASMPGTLRTRSGASPTRSRVIVAIAAWVDCLAPRLCEAG